jgi:copper chaperone CopZ
MFRRLFLSRLTLASTSVLATGGSLHAATQSVSFDVKGFTCVTCAVGLETLLREQKGVVKASASYEKATVLIEFNPALATKQSLKDSIASLGFRVAAER